MVWRAGTALSSSPGGMVVDDYINKYAVLYSTHGYLSEMKLLQKTALIATEEWWALNCPTSLPFPSAPFLPPSTSLF
jgi:hypothetical protein